MMMTMMIMRELMEIMMIKIRTLMAIIVTNILLGNQSPICFLKVSLLYC